jgi:hypothetical protein
LCCLGLDRPASHVAWLRAFSGDVPKPVTVVTTSAWAISRLVTQLVALITRARGVVIVTPTRSVRRHVVALVESTVVVSPDSSAVVTVSAIVSVAPRIVSIIVSFCALVSRLTVVVFAIAPLLLPGVWLPLRV